MGFTRVIYTDATTAEAASALKTCGFLESNKGGLYTSPSIPIKVYVVWGKSSYFPEILAKLPFPPRIQIHLKCADDRADLAELAVSAANNLRWLSPGARVCVYNVEALEEISC